MFKNQLLQTIVDVHKSGIYVYLTDAGYMEFLKMINDEEIVFEEDMERDAV